jgi:hypothetical protein
MTPPLTALRPIDQAIAMARAYASAQPRVADSRLTLHLRGKALPAGEWFRLVVDGTSFECYMRIDGDRGQSQFHRPDQRVIKTITVPDRQPVMNALDRLLAEFNAWIYGVGTVKPRNPGREVSERDLAILRCAAAIGRRDHVDLVTEHQQRYPLRPEEVPEAYETPLGPAHHLRGHARELRSVCGISGADYGHIFSAIEVADQVLNALPTEARTLGAQHFWQFFHRPIPSKPPKMNVPFALARTVNQVAVGVGGAPIMIELLDTYRDEAYELLEQALAAETHEHYSWALYDAAPLLHGAFSLAEYLGRGGPFIENAGRYKSIARDVDEKIVRVSDAFDFQLRDIDGSSWNDLGARIASMGRREGVRAVERFLDQLVEEHYWLPSVCKSDLLGFADYSSVI